MRQRVETVDVTVLRLLDPLKFLGPQRKADNEESEPACPEGGRQDWVDKCRQPKDQLQLRVVA